MLVFLNCAPLNHYRPNTLSSRDERKVRGQTDRRLHSMTSLPMPVGCLVLIRPCETVALIFCLSQLLSQGMQFSGEQAYWPTAQRGRLLCCSYTAMSCPSAFLTSSSVHWNTHCACHLPPACHSLQHLALSMGGRRNHCLLSDMPHLSSCLLIPLFTITCPPSHSHAFLSLPSLSSASLPILSHVPWRSCRISTAPAIMLLPLRL